MTREAPVRRSSVRRATLAAAAAMLALTVAPSAVSAGEPGNRVDPAFAPATGSAALSRATFAHPPASVRPMYRWWMPLAFTDDEELRRELRDIAAAGAGGVEVSPFIVPGAGHQTNAFLAEYGWGTPSWTHKIQVITDEAADLGLTVDQNLGPAYPPTVPSLNSFNQPQAEQQLIFGRELDEPGSTRSGALPAPMTAPPSVTTKLCAPATAGDDVLHVASLGGFAAGDTITVGSGASAEKVVVASLGDRTADCGDLSVSPVTGAHAVGETAVDVARTTRIKTLVAQCTTACTLGGSGPIALDPASVVDVTDRVSGGRLDHTFATGNGHPWVVIDLLQTASGLLAQSGGYTMTQPNYVVDHWSRGGVQVQTDFWDDNILTDAVQANLDRIGGGAVFEDSLELGSTQKWTWGFLQSFSTLRGYDPTLLLPALVGAGIQGTGTPAFELAGVGAQVREDYRRTLSDLYTSKYVAPMQRWAQSHGLDFRVQSYGTPIASGDAAAAAGIAEGESLNFNGDSVHRLAEQDYRVLSGGAHASGRNIVSTECCAAFFGNYRSSVAGPNVGGQYTQGGDGSQVGGKYSQGLLDSIYQAYAGGVNQLVWHGYPYRDAPAGVGTSGRDGGTWPGYHPWDIFGALNVNDEFGPRQASWSDYAEVNENLARTQLVLRQGRSTSDLAVYYEDLGLSGNSVGAQQPTQHLLGSGSATARAGYTYEYLTPRILGKVVPDPDGGLLSDGPDYQGLVVNDQTTMSVTDARRLLTLARGGLRIFVVGAAPTATTGADPDAGQLGGVVADLLTQATVTRVAGEASLPAALAAAGIDPAVRPEVPTSALGLVRREAKGVTYDFAYNRSGTTVETDLTLSGSGTPYTLDTWTGRITPVADYTTSRAGVTVHVRIPAYDKVILALAGDARLGAPPAVHALGGNADVVAVSGTSLTVRSEHDGRVVARLNDGTVRTATVSGLAAGRKLRDWSLKAQTWTPGENQYTTLRTDEPAVALTAGADGGLPSWREITGDVDLSSSSGVGVYTTRVDLPATWRPADGAYLALGDVLDTATVAVNGTTVSVNQSDRGRIDLGKTLHAGTNTIAVRVATTMFNAVRSTGDSNYQTPPWQRTGLMGPVVLRPYRDTVLAAPSKPAPPATKAVTRTAVAVTPRPVPAGRRARVVAVVTSTRPVAGALRVRVDGRVRRTATVSNGRAVVRLPRLHAGKHRVRVVFLGTSTLRASASDLVTFRVRKMR